MTYYYIIVLCFNWILVEGQCFNWTFVNERWNWSPY